jgi:hypothetical protein
MVGGPGGEWKPLPSGGPTGNSESYCAVGADGYLYAGDSGSMYRIQLQ